MAAYVELYVDKGTSFSNKITLTDDSTNTSINLSGYSARSQLRRSYYSTDAVGAVTRVLEGTLTMLPEITR